jgi:hypothetical protein
MIVSGVGVAQPARRRLAMIKMLRAVNTVLRILLLLLVYGRLRGFNLGEFVSVFFLLRLLYAPVFF